MVIFDLDGTLADCTHRMRYIQDEPKNWDAFFGAVGDDTLIHDVVAMYRLIHSSGVHIAVLTGRSEICRTKTLEWFLKHRIPYPELLMMRTARDRRPDTEVKSEMLDRLIAMEYDPRIAFEDRITVVRMWRARGLTCFQVAEGTY